MLLPYWNSELDLEIAPWFPLGVDYQPVSINRLYSPGLKRLAASCLALGSELLMIASPRVGCVGSLTRENFYRAEPPKVLNLGFMMLLGWSLPMEQVVAAVFGAIREKMGEAGEDAGLLAGVTLCSLWRQGVLVQSLKTIAIVSEEPFFDEGNVEEGTGFLAGFESLLSEAAGARSGIPFFAERFGLSRFPMLHEGGDPLQIGISHRLCEMEFPETRQILGPSPEIPFPPFVGAVLGELPI